MANNKDSAANTNKANEQQQETNANISPSRNPSNQEERLVKPDWPRGSSSRLEIGGPSSVPAPSGAGATEVGGSSTVVTTASTTPSVPARVGGSGVTVDLNVVSRPTGEGSSRRRSEKAIDNSPARKRAKGEMDAPKTEPKCYSCGKKFGTWKAVFGHMRAHRDRGWRGAFPPPTWSSHEKTAKADRTALQNQLAPTLLNLAKETLDKMNQYQAEAVSPRRERSLDFDLNIEPGGISGSNSGSSTPHAQPSSGARDFDLNMPPKNGSNENEGSSND
ncbi:unnamed protein product [Dovyalis caffra]|uniref:C2H2-type domain-containing protein n=1 Tax=Dovyalis caffra TaxID=77055 RepID=A0AAV1SPL2_9ROSI|nr:unnamed protein product [Dovyalis caffra]